MEKTLVIGKRQMECYLKIEIGMWFSIKKEYIILVDNLGEPLDSKKWTSDIKKGA